MGHDRSCRQVMGHRSLFSSHRAGQSGQVASSKRAGQSGKSEVTGHHQVTVTRQQTGASQLSQLKSIVNTLAHCVFAHTLCMCLSVSKGKKRYGTNTFFINSFLVFLKAMLYVGGLSESTAGEAKSRCPYRAANSGGEGRMSDNSQSRARSSGLERVAQLYDNGQSPDCRLPAARSAAVFGTPYHTSFSHRL